MNLEIENYWHILWIFALPFVMFLWVKFIVWRKEKRLIFSEEKFHTALFHHKKSFEKIFPFLYFVAFLFLILATLGIIRREQKEISITEKTSNIIFLIDVSNSMNAEDVAPSRLEQAKNIVSQSLENLTNDKIGIVVFAGEAQSLMPLTTDYSSAHLFVNELSTNTIQKQGTDFLLAIKEASKKLNNTPYGTKKIILLSDGEDNEGNHNPAIREAKNQGISITSIGIGTEEGAPIPDKIFNFYSDYKRDNWGQIVITQRETQALKEIAQSTGGKYIDGNDIQNAVNEILKDISSMEKISSENSIKTFHIEHFYPYFLGIAILIFFGILLFNPKKDFNF